MRRPSPQFAFVEYGDPESVLRCLEVINGAKLTGKSGEEKALLVKADEKTTARLDTYKASRVQSEVRQARRVTLDCCRLTPRVRSPPMSTCCKQRTILLPSSFA